MFWCICTVVMIPDERIVSRYMEEGRWVTVSLISWHRLHHTDQFPPVKRTESQHCVQREKPPAARPLLMPWSHFPFSHVANLIITDALCAVCLCLLHLPPALHPFILRDVACKHLPPPFLQHVGKWQCSHDGERLFQEEVDLCFCKATNTE